MVLCGASSKETRCCSSEGQTFGPWLTGPTYSSVLILQRLRQRRLLVVVRRVRGQRGQKGAGRPLERLLKATFFFALLLICV